MQSKKYKIVPARNSKKIAVIGGGIGGLETALVAAQRGHKVTIYEKSEKLGGVFNAAAAPSFKEKDRALIAWYNREIAKYPEIEVKLNTEIKDTRSIEADKIVVATGAIARELPVKGAENCIEAVDYLLGKKEVGGNVVIIGGGLTGCEIAYELYMQGKKPTIVEMKDDLIAATGICLANSSYLRDFFKTNNVPVYLEATPIEFHEDGITIIYKNDRTAKLYADSIILSIGYTPAPLASKGKVRLVGDAKKVGTLKDVIWNSWDVAMKL
jgi:2-enoate reductase